MFCLILTLDMRYRTEKVRNLRLPGSHRDWQQRPGITTQQWGGAKAGTKESRCSSTEANVTEMVEGAQKPHKSKAGQDEDGLWGFLLCEGSHGI